MSTVRIYSESDLRSPSIKEILRYARADGKSEACSLISDTVTELWGTLTLRVCYENTPIIVDDTLVDLGFAKIKSRSLQKALDGCSSAIVFASTVGLAPDRLIAKYSRLSPSKALFVQALGAERIEALCDRFEEDIKKELAPEGKTSRMRFSPGYGDLPLSLQKEIFAFLRPEKIGIFLGEGLLMTPTKSVTAIIGIKDGTK